jgi:phospholipase/carboxylesterase
MCYVIPQAADFTWYPYRFIESRAANEPGLTSGLHLIDTLVNAVIDNGLNREKVYLLGFSQGACLAADYVARNPAAYGGLFVLSGGLIGKQINLADYCGDLDNTPVFLGCSDSDFHIPESRVHETASIFEQLNADVTKRIYAGMGHTVNQDELDFINLVLGQSIHSEGHRVHKVAAKNIKI